MLSSIVEMNANIKQSVKMWDYVMGAFLVVAYIYTLPLELIIYEHLKECLYVHMWLYILLVMWIECVYIVVE